MSSGHASHQLGLDADVWLTPMPDRRLTNKEREDIAATSMLAADDISVDPKVWTATHASSLSAPPSTPRSSVYSCIQQSRRHYARRRTPTERGFPRFARILGTTTISTSASPAQRARWAVPLRSPWCMRTGTGAVRNWPTGSSWSRRSRRRPRPCRRLRTRSSQHPPSCRCLWRNYRRVHMVLPAAIPKSNLPLDAQRKADQQIAAAHAAAAQKHAAAAQKKGAPAKHETTPAPAMAAKPDTTPGPQTKAAQH